MQAAEGCCAHTLTRTHSNERSRGSVPRATDRALFEPIHRELAELERWAERILGARKLCEVFAQGR